VNRVWYLALAVAIFTVACGIYLVRPDLRRALLASAGFGAIWGPISEYWFMRDYWRPMGILGGSWLEDIVFGSGIAALSCGSYLLLARRRLLADASVARHPYVLLAFPVAYALVSQLSQSWLHLNSIIAAMLVYLGFAAFMTGLRHDLAVPAVVSGLIMACVALAGYAVGLDLVLDGKTVLSSIWLLDGQSLGVTVLGNVPLTEVLWYGCWGCLMGIAYEYVTGARLVEGSGATV
jgi:hypothetical protein